MPHSSCHHLIVQSSRLPDCTTILITPFQHRKTDLHQFIFSSVVGVCPAFIVLPFCHVLVSFSDECDTTTQQSHIYHFRHVQQPVAPTLRCYGCVVWVLVEGNSWWVSECSLNKTYPQHNIIALLTKESCVLTHHLSLRRGSGRTCATGQATQRGHSQWVLVRLLQVHSTWYQRFPLSVLLAWMKQTKQTFIFLKNFCACERTWYRSLVPTNVETSSAFIPVNRVYPKYDTHLLNLRFSSRVHLRDCGCALWHVRPVPLHCCAAMSVSMWYSFVDASRSDPDRLRSVSMSSFLTGKRRRPSVFPFAMYWDWIDSTLGNSVCTGPHSGCVHSCSTGAGHPPSATSGTSSSPTAGWQHSAPPGSCVSLSSGSECSLQLLRYGCKKDMTSSRSACLNVPSIHCYPYPICSVATAWCKHNKTGSDYPHTLIETDKTVETMSVGRRRSGMRKNQVGKSQHKKEECSPDGERRKQFVRSESSVWDITGRKPSKLSWQQKMVHNINRTVWCYCVGTISCHRGTALTRAFIVSHNGLCCSAKVFTLMWVNHWWWGRAEGVSGGILSFNSLCMNQKYISKNWRMK